MSKINSLPEYLQEVPSDRQGWLLWRQNLLVYREYVRREMDRDSRFSAIQYALAADDPAYFLAMFCPIYEPRTTIDIRLDGRGNEVQFDKPPGWYPWVPFPFQVDLVRWLVDVKSRTWDPTGKGDGVIEKSRDMGASWIFCLMAAHDWLFGNNIHIGLVSRKEDLVDAPDDPRSLFYKIRALVGLYEKVPEQAFCPGGFWDGLPTRLPDVFMPQGFDFKFHSFRGKLYHPTKNNSILGDSTSSKTGVAARFTWMGIDEGSKIEELARIWGGLAPVTLHRFVLSSADLEYGPDFYNLARAAERAATFNEPGPSFFQIPWNVHPLRTDGWLESERARSTDPHDFAREYEMNYQAGFGDWVYPYAQQMMVKPVTFVETSSVDFGIDPGIRDPTAVHAFQFNPGLGRHQLIDSITLKTPTSAYLAPLLMGFPPGHEVRNDYDMAAQEFMDFTWSLRDRGVARTYAGDPYGDSSVGSISTSFYEALYETCQEYCDKYPDLPRMEIIVETKYDQGARYHPARRDALAAILPVMDIADNPGGRKFLHALQNQRYKSQDPGRTSANEPARPEHGPWSHDCSAAEYYAVQAQVIQAFAPRATHEKKTESNHHTHMRRMERKTRRRVAA